MRQSQLILSNTAIIWAAPGSPAVPPVDFRALPDRHDRGGGLLGLCAGMVADDVNDEQVRRIKSQMNNAYSIYLKGLAQ